jgi:hypothetical protein
MMLIKQQTYEHFANNGSYSTGECQHDLSVQPVLTESVSKEGLQH